MELHQSIRKFAGPSAHRRVGIPSGWSCGQRVLFSIDPGDPSSPETSHRWTLEVTLATLWRSKGRFLSIFGPQISHRFLNRFLHWFLKWFWINFGTILFPFFIIFASLFRTSIWASIFLRFSLDFWYPWTLWIELSPRRGAYLREIVLSPKPSKKRQFGIHFFIIFTIILASFSTLFRHRFWYRFLHRFWINFGSKMAPKIALGGAFSAKKATGKHE